MRTICGQHKDAGRHGHYLGGEEQRQERRRHGQEEGGDRLAGASVACAAPGTTGV